MVIWRIEKVPTLDAEDSKISLIYEKIRELLFLFHDNAFNGMESLEINFVHGTGDEIEIYFSAKGFTEKDIEDSITHFFSELGYVFSKLNNEKIAELNDRFSSYSNGSISAVRKAETIAQTTFYTQISPCGYFYWSNHIETDETSTIKNLDSVFSTLQSCEDSFITLQIMPFRFSDKTKSTYKLLSFYLDNQIQNNTNNPNLITGNNMYTSGAKKTYDYINQKSELPFFKYNILIGSKVKKDKIITDQITTHIKTQSSNSPQFNTIVLKTESFDFYDKINCYKINNYLLRDEKTRFKPSLWNSGKFPTELLSMPLIVSADEALSYFVLPYNDGSIPGVHGTYLTENTELIADSVTDSENIIFGNIIGNNEKMIGSVLDNFSKHIIIAGMPGTGKTTFAMGLLYQIHKKQKPFLIIEPVKTEYRSLISVIPDLQIFSPNNNEMSPFFINPFMPPEGVKIKHYKPSLIKALESSVNGFSESPLNDIFIDALNECYVEYNWSDDNILGDKDTVPFGMAEFINVFNDVMKKKQYYGDARNIAEAGRTRLKTLISFNPDIFDTVQNIPVSDLISKPTVIELNYIDNKEEKALITALILTRIRCFVNNGLLKGKGLKSVLMLDEAHVFLDSDSNEKSTDVRSRTKSLLESIVLETRAQGLGMIIADQTPSIIGEKILANADIKVIFRLVAKNEKDIVLSSANFSSTADKQLSSLQLGQAFAFFHELSNPVLISTPDLFENYNLQKYISNEEIRKKMKYWDNHSEFTKPFTMCRFCQRKCGCDFSMRSDARFTADCIWKEKYSLCMCEVDGKTVSSEVFLKTLIKLVPSNVPNRIKEKYIDNWEDFVICVKIALIRKAQLEKEVILNRKQETIMMD